MKKALAFVIALVIFCIPTVAMAETPLYDESGSYDYLEIAAKDYNLNNDYSYTIFVFEPTETGKYTFYSENNLMGIVSYNGMWVSIEPSETTVCEDTIVWECTGVGQSVWIAVKNNGETANITVTDEELIIVVIPRTEYENKADIADFVFDGDADELSFVDTYDDVANTAVLGEDGYYHLDSANGPKLYVTINYGMNLPDAMGYGQLKGSVTENGEVVEIVDYNNAFGEYASAADADTMMYPLTEDLMTIYKEVGAYQSWYGEDGWIGGEEEDAWMFACCYDENDITVVPGEDSSEEESSEDTVEDESSEEESEETTAPGDGSASGFMFVLLAAFALISATALFINKKQRNF